MPLEIYLNVAISGILTGLVYGLMALGLSCIFGVVRIVNFAHGEMMTVGMYLAVLLFSTFGLDPLIMLVPIAAVLFVFGYALQRGVINAFVTRPSHAFPFDDCHRDHHGERASDHLRAGRTGRADELRL